MTTDSQVHPPGLASPTPADWHARSAEAVLAHFQTVPSGLLADEAARRLAADGANELTVRPRTGLFRMLLGQFKSVIIWILIGAGIASGVLGEVLDAAAILAIVVLNAVVGFYQESKAEQSIAALRKMAAPRATLLRDGQVIEIPAAGVVTGDILHLEAGQVVAADARVLDASSLSCVEAALTGESDVVPKRAATMPAGPVSLADRENMLFMGTAVATGTGRAVVVATAMASELGRIAGLINDADADVATPLQRKLDAFGRVLVWAALGIVAVLFGLGWLRGTPLMALAMTAISLAVAAVPEGLPAIVTVALSIGVLRMAQRRALVRRLAAVETLGSTNVICTDKTGTLTVGDMTARVLWVANRRYDVTGEGYGPDGRVCIDGGPAEGEHRAPLLELGTILLACNHAHLVLEDGIWRTVGDPTEGALLVAGAKTGADRDLIDREYPVQHVIPFDSDRKRSAVIRRRPDGSLRSYVNGAPGPLLDCCTRLSDHDGIRPMSGPDRERIRVQTAAMANQALRVLASAFGEPSDPLPPGVTAETIERDLVFVGLTGIYDPPRPEAKHAVAVCKAAGIRVVMITGDHPHTAQAIATELGIGSTGAAVTGTVLDGMADDELRRRVADIDVYARVTADHKLRIVRALKANGDVVAMTGDGVNDAPAIRGADIGIAMGRSGTEVARQAADMIITDDHFATIVAAVQEGRGIYNNIRKTLQYLLAGNTGELLLMAGCVAANLPSPLLPIHLLWINLVTDGLPALCLATDPVGPDVMTRRPRQRSERLTDRGFVRTMLMTGGLTAGVAFAVYVVVGRTGPIEAARASAFAVLVFAELLRSFGARSETVPVWRIPLLTNVHLPAVVAASMALQVWSQHSPLLGRILKTSPLPFSDGLLLLAVGAVPLAGMEIVKVVTSRSRAAGASS